MYRHALKAPATTLISKSFFLVPATRHAPLLAFNAARTMATVATRVSDRIKHDHRELEAYYKKIKTATSEDEKVRWQNQFVWELARHSIAEEIVVYPAMEKYLPDGVKMAEKDRGEHQIVCFFLVFFFQVFSNQRVIKKKVKEKLYTFQKLSPSDPEFVPTIDSLWQALTQHILEEERDDLPSLEAAIEEAESGRLAASFARTKHFVPTQSHPGAPDRPPYETAAGLLAAPIDKLMDLFKKFPNQDETKV